MRRGALPWAIFAVIMALAIPAVPLVFRNTPEIAGEQVLYFAIFACYGAIGAFIASRRPENPIGWIVLAVSAFTGTAFFSEQYAVYGLATEPGSLPAADLVAWPSFWMWMPGIALLTTILPLLFPTGRLPSPRWRPVAYLAAGWIVVLSLFFALTEASHERFPVVRNPLGLLTTTPRTLLEYTIGPVFVALLVAAVASQVVRFRGGSAAERQQLKWFAAAIAFLAIALLLEQFVSGIPLLASIATLISPVALAALPVAIGIAILRYHLYEIDRIISRTVGWAIVSGILVAVFGAVVLGFQAILAGVTQGETLAVAASTLVAAALFQPVRTRVQRAVDRRFHRSRYDAEQTAARFADRLRDELDLAALQGEVGRVVGQTMAPRTSAVWLRKGPG